MIGSILFSFLYFLPSGAKGFRVRPMTLSRRSAGPPTVFYHFKFGAAATCEQPVRNTDHQFIHHHLEAINYSNSP
jgi:hypothetical protein